MISWSGQCDAFHRERPSSPATVTGDREGRDASRELLADEPMTAAAPAYESDCLILRANLEEETFRGTLPSPHDDSLGRIDSYLARHSLSSTVPMAP